MPGKTITTEDALALTKIDFEQRSQQVIQLQQDRSRFIRLAVLVWGAPLAIAATVLTQLTGLEDVLSPPLTRLVIAGTSFVFSNLVNCALLAALLGNRNTSNLAAAGMNYIREVYLHALLNHEVLDSDPALAKVTGVHRDKPPRFRAVVSASTDLVLMVMVGFNVLYGCIGAAIAIWSSVNAATFVAPLLALALFFNWVIFRGISVGDALGRG